MNAKYKLILTLLLSTMMLAAGFEYYLNKGILHMVGNEVDNTDYSVNTPTVVPFAVYSKKESGKKQESGRTSKSLNYDNMSYTESRSSEELSVLLNGSGTKHTTTIRPDVKQESIELFSSSAAPSGGLLAFRGSSRSILNDNPDSRAVASVGTLASRLSVQLDKAGLMNDGAGIALIDPSADPDAAPIPIDSGLWFLILACGIYGVLKLWRR